MNTPKMKGGLTVTGLITGGWLVKDIQVSVPHGIAVFIPADQVYKSKDLWRGIQQGRIFPLTGGSGLAVEPIAKTAPDTDAVLMEAQAENKRLRRDLAQSEQHKLGLQEALQAMQGQLSAIQRLLGRFENGEIPLVAVQTVQAVAAPAMAPAPEPNRAVGGETPAFIPEEIKPEGAEASIKVEPEVVEGTSVMDAAKALRKARGKG